MQSNLVGAEKIRSSPDMNIVGFQPKQDARAERHDWPHLKAPTINGRTAGHAANETGAERRVLIVDDEPEIYEGAREIAESVGYAVQTSADATGFRAACESFQPNVIVLDLKLPGTDGIELLRFLAAAKSNAAIVLMSGVDKRALGTAARLGRELGLRVAATLSKPTGISQLRTVLETVAKEGPPLGPSDLRRGIDAGELFLEYQPKVDLRSSARWEFTAVEALVRWRHPDNGVLQPDSFVPLAEESGLAEALTWAVLEEALAQARQWLEEGIRMKVAVNIPTALLAGLELPDQVLDALRRFDLDGSMLILEITETGAMADPVLAMDVLTRLRLKGVKISMDDFGTGFSSLVQLHRLPFSELKIDKSFVLEVGTNEEARIIVRSIAELAHSFGLDLCAEGVEDETALDFVRSVGCDVAQGYYFSRPVPAPDLSKLIRSWRCASSPKVEVAS